MIEQLIDNSEGGKEMDKQTEAKEEKPEETPKEKEPSLINDANLAAERLEAANAKQEELLKKQEEMAAKQRLGGTTEGGQGSEKHEETDEEYTARFQKGEVNPLEPDAK